MENIRPHSQNTHVHLSFWCLYASVLSDKIFFLHMCGGAQILLRNINLHTHGVLSKPQLNSSQCVYLEWNPSSRNNPKVWDYPFYGPFNRGHLWVILWFSPNLRDEYVIFWLWQQHHQWTSVKRFAYQIQFLVFSFICIWSLYKLG